MLRHKISLATSIILTALFVSIPGTAQALTVSSSNSDSGAKCTQTVSNNTYVTVSRYGNDCVIIFNTADNKNTYNLTWTVPSGLSSIKTLIVGGGGGGSSDVAGGGGGGQVRLDTLTVVGNSSIAIVVGKGGLPGTGTNGASSGGAVGDTSSVTVSGISTSALGGGGGANRYSYVATTSGYTGGGASYSGSTGTTNGTTGVGGSPYAGGKSVTNGNNGGGGGAGGKGGDATSSISGAGGPGVTTDLTGTSTCYGGGGSGGVYPSGSSGSVTCGGGIGSFSTTHGSDGAQNLGGGGGGDGSDASGVGGNGGSGIIVIRYTIPVSGPGSVSLVASNTRKLLTTTITATLNPSTGGTLTFFANGRTIPRCSNLNISSGTATCNWNPLTHGLIALTAYFYPTDSLYTAASSMPVSYVISKRITPR